MSFLIVKRYKEFLISVFYYFPFTETIKTTIFYTKFCIIQIPVRQETLLPRWAWRFADL